jgi:O-antigen/teichoic acid export membrane protein
MRSTSVSARAEAAGAPGVLTSAESTFRNPKIQRAALIAYKSAADAAAKAVLFVVTVLAARLLPSREFGVFALGTTIGWLLAVAGDFGLQMHIARAVARQPEAAAALLHRWGRIRIGAAAAGMAVLAVSLTALRVSADTALAIFLLALTYAALGLVEFLNYFYRGLSRSDLEATLTIVQRAATLVFAVAALLWRTNVTALAIAMLIPAVATLACSAQVASRLASTHNSPSVTARLDLGRALVRDVAPIGLGVLLSALYFRVDILLIERWAGIEAVAQYNAVFRVVDALRLFPAAVLAVTLPALVRARDLGPVTRAAATLCGFGVGCATILWVASDRIVTLLYGPAYAPAISTLRVLAFGLPLMSLNYALTYHLIAWNRHRAYAGLCAAALAVNLALNARLIPALSIEGAAWATVGTEAVLTAGCFVVLSLRS